MLVPLAAKAPSFAKAGGSASAGTRDQSRPPFAVVRIQNFPSTESPITIPWSASQKDIWIFIAELEDPGCSAIKSLVNPRSCAIANAQDVSSVLTDSVDVTKVESVAG